VCLGSLGNGKKRWKPLNLLESEVHYFFLGEGISRIYIISRMDLPETNSSHLKMDDWTTILSFWDKVHFQGRTVSFRKGDLYVNVDCTIPD